MAHMLSTVNPEAAERIGTIEVPDTPPVGATVIYNCRSGEGRRGRQQFPAMVLDRDEKLARVILLVFFDAEDLKGTTWCPPRTDRQVLFSWEPVSYNAPAILSDIESDGIEKLKFAFYGDYEPPAKPLIEIIADLEARIIKLEAKR